MKKLFFCAAALFAAISFAACSDDDDETNLTATPETIAGTWQITYEEGVAIYDGEEETWSENYPDEDGWYWTLAFDKNGTCIDTDYETGDDPYSIRYTYSISGSTLILKKANDESYTYEIKALTQSKLVLFGFEDRAEYTSTYKRIK